ncbi:MAG: hypothetical protein K6F97_05630 [Lachnospiraceae bacterium]|nr:hypothetical protein [Lachnospiraceae bacterium]
MNILVFIIIVLAIANKGKKHRQERIGWTVTDEDRRYDRERADRSVDQKNNGEYGGWYSFDETSQGNNQRESQDFAGNPGGYQDYQEFDGNLGGYQDYQEFDGNNQGDYQNYQGNDQGGYEDYNQGGFQDFQRNNQGDYRDYQGNPQRDYRDYQGNPQGNSQRGYREYQGNDQRGYSNFQRNDQRGYREYPREDAGNYNRQANYNGNQSYQLRVPEPQRVSAFFSNNYVNYPANQRIKGASVSSTFGDVKLDISRAILMKNTEVYVSSVFGNAQIIVPKGVNVELKGVPVFGSFTEEHPGEVNPYAPTVRVNGSCLFGNISIKKV